MQSLLIFPFSTWICCCLRLSALCWLTPRRLMLKRRHGNDPPFLCFHYRIMAELETAFGSFFNDWQSLNRCCFYRGSKSAGLQIYVLLLAGTSFISHLHCCLLASLYVVCEFSQTVCRLIFGCFFCLCFVCVFSSKLELIYLLQARSAYSTINASRSILPRHLPSFNVHTFRQPIVSFVGTPPLLITPQVLPIAAGLFDANKSFRRCFLMKAR